MTEQMNLFGDTAGAGSTEPALSHEQAAARAAELRHELDYHAYRYYMLDAPEITDAALSNFRKSSWHTPI